VPSITHLAAFVYKHIVLLINQKDYVTFYKLPRWIMDYWAVRKYDEEMYRACGSKPDAYLVRPAVREMIWKRRVYEK